MFLDDFLFAVYDVEYSVCVSSDTNNRKKWKSKTQNPKNQKAPRKIMEHEIRKLVVVYTLVYTAMSVGVVLVVTHSKP